MLFAGYPNEAVVFYPMIKDLLHRFFSAYIIPAVFVFLSVYFAIKASICKNRENEPENKTEEVPSHLRLAGWFEKNKLQVLSLVITAVLLIVLRYGSLGENVFSGDEFSYLYQAKIMSHLKLSVPAPDPAPSFMGDQIVNNGKFFSKYTVGFPVLLIPFVMIGNPFILNPILAVFAIVVMYRLGKELYDGGTALFAAVLLAVSPFFILNSITILVHTGFLLFFLLFLLCYIKSLREKSPLYPIAAGASIGFAMLIRPADTLFPVILFCIVSLFVLIKGGIPGETTGSDNRKFLLGRFLLMIAGASVFAGFLLYVNYAQTGSPLKFSFQEYISEEKWGLGVMGHNHIRAIWNSTFALTRLFVWLPPLVIGFSVLSLFEKTWKNALLALIALCPFVFYYFYYGIGFHEFGPRYYFLTLAALPLLASRGMIMIENLLRAKQKSAPAAAIAFCIIILFNLAAVFPGIVNESTAYPRGLTFFFRDVDQKFRDSGEGVILFLQTTPHQLLVYYTRNEPDLSNKNIIANFLDMETNRKVIEKFPNKKPILVNFDEQTQQWSYSPWYDKSFDQLPTEEKVRIYITSAFNYAIAVRDFKKAIEQADLGLKVAPEEFRLYNVKGMMQKANLDSAGAEQSYKTSIKLNPTDMQTIYDLAVLQREMGKKDEAKANFEKCIAGTTDPKMQNIARMWLEHLNKGN